MLQYYVMLCYAVFHTVRYYTMRIPCSNQLYSTIPYGTILLTVLFYIMLCCFMLFYIVLPPYDNKIRQYIPQRYTLLTLLQKLDCGSG